MCHQDGVADAAAHLDPSAGTLAHVHARTRQGGGPRSQASGKGNPTSMVWLLDGGMHQIADEKWYEQWAEHLINSGPI